MWVPLAGMVLFQGEDSLVKLALAVKTCVRAMEDHPGCSEVFIRTMDRFVGSCVNWITLSVVGLSPLPP